MKKMLLTSAVAAMVLGGCASPQPTKSDVAVTDKAAVNKTVAGQPNQATQPAMGNATSLYPPNARPGECYARVLTPAAYKTIQQRVIAKSEGENIEVVPAVYKTVTKKVLVSEATTKLKVIPETYKTITERVLIEPAREVLKKVPAKYKTVKEKVLVKPSYTTWKRGQNPVGRASKVKYDQSTGEIMCLITVPAEYKTVTKQVLVSPATTAKSVIPAKYKTVTKRVVATPATTKKVTVPARYKTVQVRELVTPAKTLKTKIPATYKVVTKRVIASQPRLEWRSILCETNTTPDVIRRLQQALKKNGYNPGRFDGVLGRETLTAVVRYQKANNLPSGQLTLATLKSLGVVR